MSFLANLRKGDIERDNVPIALVVRPRELSEGGVARPCPIDEFIGPDDLDVLSDINDSVSSFVSEYERKRCRTFSISTSVRVMRSRRFFQRAVDSACLRRHSPFFVTRS